MVSIKTKGIKHQPLQDRERFDRSLILTFYILLIISVLSSFFYVLFYSDEPTLPFFLYFLLQILMIMFFFLGLVTYVFKFKRGHIRFAHVASFVIVVLALIATIILNLDRANVDLDFFLYLTLDGDAVLKDFIIIFIDLSAAFAWAYLIGFGVIGVSTAILRQDIPRLLAFVDCMDIEEKSLRNRLVIGAFSIPKIVSIKGVELGPMPSEGDLPLEGLRRTFLLMIYFAILVPSYIFLNPLFLINSGTVDLVALAIGASLFIPVVIFPFSCITDTSARIISGCRDFHLGEGFRHTITNFLGWGTVILLLILSLQLTTISEIINMYLVYMSIAVCVALVYTYIYYNYFQSDLVNDIVVKFTKLRSERAA